MKKTYYKRNMKRIDIGFVEKCESWRLRSRFFPSKVGGKPAWLNLKNIPTIENIECRACNNPCIFLCQIYAPYEEDPQAFHRMLYVFVCKNEACCTANKNSNLRILRSQLPRQNEFYPFDPPDEHENWRPDIETEKWVKTCQVCGILAPRHCAKCKNASYCCRPHQLLDWKAGHKQRCNTDLQMADNTVGISISSNGILFPEYELVTESEVESIDESEDNDVVKEKEEMEHFESLVKSGKAGTLQTEQNIDTDLQKMSHEDHDETFTEFSEKIKKHPDQVLRYDRGGKPLYISANAQPTDIPKCEECNSERQFEFQIMPQLLNYLNFQDVLASVDWGTLLIFTCRNSCVPKAGYVAEYVFKQDIVQVPNKTDKEL